MKEQRIQSTDQYHLFKTIGANREVDKAHVKKLATAISNCNMLHLNPIIVNTSMEVIDGQHRLAAAKQLRLPVYYVIDESVSKVHIATLNSNMKNWSTMDYVNYWQREKRPGFAELSRFINKSGLPVTASVCLLSATYGGGDLVNLRNGNTDVSNIDQAEEILAFMQAIATDYLYKWFLASGPAKALRKMWDHPDFDAAVFRSKIDAQPRTLVPCTSDKNYLAMFSEIYNYKLQYRIDFRARRKEVVE